MFCEASDGVSWFDRMRARPRCPTDLTAAEYARRRLEFYRQHCISPTDADREPSPGANTTGDVEDVNQTNQILDFNMGQIGRCWHEQRSTAEEFQLEFLRQLRADGMECISGSMYNEILAYYTPKDIERIFYAPIHTPPLIRRAVPELPATVRGIAQIYADELASIVGYRVPPTELVQGELYAQAFSREYLSICCVQPELCQPGDC